MSRKIGLYGGTFDPIHFGHLNLALDIQEINGFDEVWLIPTGVNPFKVDQTAASADHRLKMTEIAAKEFPELSVNDLEIRRSGISYAIDSLNELIPAYPDAEFAILIGEDAASGFFRWKAVKEVIELVSICVGRRSCQNIISELDGDQEVLQALKKGYTETKILEISSTDIRQRLRQGLTCRHLVPPKVLDYISKNQLYL